MKKRFGFGVFLSILILAAGCIPTINPLYTEKDLLEDPRLEGEWIHEDSEQGWSFAKSGDRQYELVFTDKQKREGRFIARLFKLDETLYLDLFPQKPHLDAPEFYKLHLLPAHTFMRVRFGDKRLGLAPVHPERLEKLLKADPDGMPYVRRKKVNPRILLIGSTAQLQAFVRKHGPSGELFADDMELKKQ